MNSHRHMNSVRLKNALALAAAALAICLSLCLMAKTKEPPWIAKNWTQWGDDDCHTILYKSPWVRSEESTVECSGCNKSAILMGSVVQIRSALPFRQALLKRLELDNGYDKMKPDKKEAFDQVHLHDLDPTDQILILIVNTSGEPPPGSRSAQRDNVYGPRPPRQAALRIADGTFVAPVKTTSVKYFPSAIGGFYNQFEYVFPRTVGGKPLYLPSDSFLIVELGAPLLLDQKTHQIIRQPFQDSGKGYTFKISNLMYKGKLEY
jgi:hypothetical protein